MTDRYLVFLRHGKAMVDSATGFDADRPLAERGGRQARWMGDELRDAGFSGATIVASPAARTWSTACIVAEALGVEPIEDDRLFIGRGVGDVFEVLADYAAEERLIVVGHNPTISLASSVFTSGVGPCSVSLRTGAAAVCAHRGMIEPGGGRLEGVWRQAT